MTHFIHCNNCLRTPTEVANGSIKFFITECQRLFCSDCVHQYGQNCGQCPTIVCKSIELNDKSLVEDVKVYFRSISEELNGILKIQDFQSKQFSSLCAHLNRRLIQLDKQVINFQNQSQNLDNELRCMKERVARLQDEAKLAAGQPSAGASHTFQSIFNANAGHNSSIGEMTANDLLKDSLPQSSQTSGSFSHQFNGISMAPNISINCNQQMNASYRRLPIPTRNVLTQPKLQMQIMGSYGNQLNSNLMPPIKANNSMNPMNKSFGAMNTPTDSHRQSIRGCNQVIQSNVLDIANPLETIIDLSAPKHSFNKIPVGQQLVSKVNPSPQSYGQSSVASRIVPSLSTHRNVKYKSTDAPHNSLRGSRGYVTTLSQLSASTNASGLPTRGRNEPSFPYSPISNCTQLYRKTSRY